MPKQWEKLKSNSLDNMKTFLVKTKRNKKKYVTWMRGLLIRQRRSGTVAKTPGGGGVYKSFSVKSGTRESVHPEGRYEPR